MSQLVGRKLPQSQIPSEDFIPVSAENTDHYGNAALYAMIFGSGNKSHQIVAGNIVYVGEAAPGSLETEAKWRVTKQEDLSAGAGTNIVVTHAYVPAAGAVPAKYSGFDHIFNNYATLTYA